ncbi:MAG: toll/interleukin-1 receptor domain-containing protein [Burkholderiales bacterium]|nr:toll/interleukin-1 receptor domain-containing protein [Burkholderiales bacterium]
MDAAGTRLKYWAFLSYSHRDARWANWLHRSVESYRPPKALVGTLGERGPVPRRLSPLFRDREELATATDLGTVIAEALRQSACQIVICSRQSAKSRWVNEEILAFKRLGRDDRIFCLIIDGEPNASDNPATADEECFPPALRYQLDAAGNLSSTRTEPIAADARPGKDGRNNAKLKLIAGVLGVGFDALRRREAQRRTRRLAAIASAMTMGMIATTGLATYALVQRGAAQRQKVRAEAEAETAKQTTKFLVDLFRISDPSEARGNTVTAREMLDKGATRIDAELSGQPAIQATLLDTVGTVYMGLGLYQQARPLLERAVGTRRRLLDSDPVANSDSLNHLGDVLTLQAEFTIAERTFRESIAKLRAQPASSAQQAALARSLHGLGMALSNQGTLPEAEQQLRAALAMQRALFGEVNGEVARTLEDLGQVVDQRGDLKAAIPLMQSALAIQRQLHGTDPHPDLAEAINNLAFVYEEKADHDDAEKLFREGLAMNRRLLGDKHKEIAIGLSNLAYVLQEKGDLSRAEATFRQTLAMQRELLGNVHPDVAMTLNNLAYVYAALHDTSNELRTQRESLAIYQQLFPGDHPDVARVANQLGFFLTEANQYAEAERQVRDSLGMRRRLLGNAHPDVASSLTSLAILQVATHKYADALDSACEAVKIYSAALSATHWRTAIPASAQGAALAGLGRYAEAEKILPPAYQILTHDIGASKTYVTLAQRYLDDLHRREALGAIHP